MRPHVTHERLVALFFLGVVLFTPPFLDIFNSQARTFGVPNLYLYLFIAWTALIALVALAVERSGVEEGGAGEAAEPGGEDRGG